MSWGNCSKAEGVPEEAEDAVGEGADEETYPERAIVGGGDATESYRQHKPENGEDYVGRQLISLFFSRRFAYLSRSNMRSFCKNLDIIIISE